MANQAPEVTAHAIRRVEKLVSIYTQKSGTTTHPDPAIYHSVIQCLARNLDKLGHPLCPCRFYPDAAEEARHRTWICACDDMQIYKYCHCLLFVNSEGHPLTEYLPGDHPGRSTYGLIVDPSLDKGRPMRTLAEEREVERKQRSS
jgi:ferredoxin-thioredoxin reductase catalytic chain